MYEWRTAWKRKRGEGVEVCDVCRKTLEKEEYTISVRKGTYYNRWECCSEKCLGVAVEKEKIKIPVATAYQEIIEGEQVQTAEKLKKARKTRKQNLIMQVSAMILSITAIILNIITVVIMTMQ